MGGLGRVLVGRDRELAALARAAERAAVGETQVAIVSGGAGVGKTALLRSAIGSLTDVSTTAPSRLGPVIAAAQGVQLAGGAIPFGITSQLLEDLSGQVRPDWTSELAEERRAELGRLHPAFRIGGEKTARGVLDRLVLTAAWRDLVATVASSRLLVLVVDDLQWVDEGSSDLLASLLSGMANLPVLLLASLRSPTTESSWQVRQVASLVRHPGNTFLDLLPLQEKDVRRFIAMRDEHTLSRTQVCRVVRLAEGVPLYVEQLLDAGPSEGNLPTTFSALVAAQLADLPAPAVALLGICAVEERPVRRSDLTAVTGLPDEELACSLAVLVRSGLLDAVGPGCYRFHHVVVRLATLDLTPEPQRADQHQAWARHLEARGIAGEEQSADHVLGVAHHWYHSGDTGRADHWARLAAESASQLDAAPEAALHWQRVLDLKIATGPDREEVVMRLWRALSASGQTAESRALLRDELNAQPAPTGLHRLNLELMLLQALEALPNADTMKAGPTVHHVTRLAREVLADPGKRGPPAVLMSVLCNVLSRVDLPGDIVVAAERILSESDVQEEEDDHTRQLRLLARGIASMRHGDVAAALAIDLEATDRARAADPFWTHRSAALVVEDLIALGRPHEAARYGEDALRGLGPVELARNLYLDMCAALVNAHVLAGEWSSARDLFAIQRHHADWKKLGQSAGLLAEVAIWQNRLDDADELCAIAVADMASSTSPMAWRYHAPLASACLAVSRGDIPGAKAHLEPILSACTGDVDDTGLWEAVLWGSKLAWLGGGTTTDRGEWEQTVRRAAEATHAVEALGAAWTADVTANLDRATGTDRVRSWHTVAEAWAIVGAPHHEAVARVRAAETGLRATADHDSTIEDDLRKAVALANRCGADSIATEAHRVARRARLNLPGARPSPLSGPIARLTARELDVLHLVASGSTNQQIADQLFMSPKTASVHVSRILDKLSARNRTQAAAIAHRAGLGDEPNDVTVRPTRH